MFLKEHKPFLGSMDKACRHLVKESLALMATFMIKQRSILGSSFAAGVPRTFRNKILKSPLALFDVTPRAVMEEVRQQYDSFIQNRAFASAVARLGNVNKFRGTSRIIRNKVTIVSRGAGLRGQSFRGNVTRGNRGFVRGSLRGVRRSASYVRNMRGYARRDRALKESESQSRGRASTSVAGFSGESRL